MRDSNGMGEDLMLEIILVLFKGPAAMATGVGLGILIGAMFVSTRYGISYVSAFHLIIARIRQLLGL